MVGDEYLTVAQVSEQLQVHPETVTRWIRKGDLQGYLLSRRAGYRISVSDFRRFMGEHRRNVLSDSSPAYDIQDMQRSDDKPKGLS